LAIIFSDDITAPPLLNSTFGGHQRLLK